MYNLEDAEYSGMNQEATLSSSQAEMSTQRPRLNTILKEQTQFAGGLNERNILWEKGL
jgi:hypothetical protein